MTGMVADWGTFEVLIQTLYFLAALDHHGPGRGKKHQNKCSSTRKVAFRNPHVRFYLVCRRLLTNAGY